MECIEFRYCFKDGDEATQVKKIKRDENGICDVDVCEMFVDFMRQVGFAEKNVYKYFRDEE